LLDADLALRNSLGLTTTDSFEGFAEEEIIDLVTRYALWPAVDSYRRAPWLARYAVRRQRHRIDERAPGEKRDLWGMPDELGYFADDNSLLKSTFKNLSISGEKNPYGTSRISSGLVCCHIWPRTTGDPLLFSFLPNLVWVPKSLSRFTDVFGDRATHKVHFVLQTLSHSRYRELDVLTGSEQVSDAWKQLTNPLIDLDREFQLNEMFSEPSLSNRVKTRHERLLTFLTSALEENPGLQRRFSKRYHLGRGPGIDKSVPSINELVSRDKIVDLKRIIEETSPTL
jgi:hypothetical protein